MPLTFDAVREIALALPGVEDGVSYGTPAIKVKGKLLARLWADGETLVLRTDLDAREILLASAPEVFFLTDHYRGYPWVLVHLGAAEPGPLRDLLEEAWRLVAPRSLQKARPRQARPIPR